MLGRLRMPSPRRPIEPWRQTFSEITITNARRVLVTCSSSVRHVSVRWRDPDRRLPQRPWVCKEMDGLAGMKAEVGMYAACRLLGLQVVPETILVKWNEAGERTGILSREMQGGHPWPNWFATQGKKHLLHDRGSDLRYSEVILFAYFIGHTDLHCRNIVVHQDMPELPWSSWIGRQSGKAYVIDGAGSGFDALPYLESRYSKFTARESHKPIRRYLSRSRTYPLPFRRFYALPKRLSPALIRAFKQFNKPNFTTYFESQLRPFYCPDAIAGIVVRGRAICRMLNQHRL